MKDLIIAESKRVFPLWIFILFVAVTFAYSVREEGSVKESYTSYSETEGFASGGSVLSDARGREWETDIVGLLRGARDGTYPENSYEANIAHEISMALYGKRPQELSDSEVEDFYANRQEEIRFNLENSATVSYDEKDVDSIMARAKEAGTVPVAYSAGWSSLNNGMSNFIPILALALSVLMLPFFGEDPSSSMRELALSSKMGKMRLDIARVVDAYVAGSIAYAVCVAEYAAIKLADLGAGGGGLPIQGSPGMVYSVVRASFIKQFFINCGMGYLSLLVSVSIMLLVSILVRQMLACLVILASFWTFLLLGEQMGAYVANHWFFNFMPLRMARFNHYYTENDIYRIGAARLNGFEAAICVGVLIVLATVGISCLALYAQHEGGKWKIKSK